MRAAFAGNIRNVEVLLESGADVNARADKFGFTALMMAIDSSRPDDGTDPATAIAIVKTLLEAGADPI